MKHLNTDRRTYGDVMDRDSLAVCTDAGIHPGCIYECPSHNPEAYSEFEARHRSDEPVRMICPRPQCRVHAWSGFPGDGCPGCHITGLSPVTR